MTTQLQLINIIIITTTTAAAAAAAAAATILDVNFGDCSAYAFM